MMSTISFIINGVFEVKMCGFICSTTNIPTSANVHVCRRGPHYYTEVTIDGIRFSHNLLSMTGEFTVQPLMDSNRSVVCLFNGEVYNYKSFGDFASDGLCLIPLYKEYGSKFVSKLDGEFSIVIVDFKKKRVIISSDSFRTKPLWFGKRGSDFCVGSYASCVKGCGFVPKQVKANQCLELSFSLKLLNKFQVTKFDLRQHKKSYDDWELAFSESVKKRASDCNSGVFIGLSSGYDSGAIACELTRLGLLFTGYSVPAAEDKSVLKARRKLVGNFKSVELTQEEFDFRKKSLGSLCDDFVCRIGRQKYSVHGDKASVGLSAICDRAVKDGNRIYLSGQGADEIISDYGHNGRKFYSHSQFGGKFPADLTTVFPWRSFYGGTQAMYLAKEELIAGAFGVEARYPFLDVQLVQEFLWLHIKYKNARYKAPIDVYLRKFDWPFKCGEKMGFRASYGLRKA